jgi:hypothetical protein
VALFFNFIGNSCGQEPPYFNPRYLGGALWVEEKKVSKTPSQPISRALGAYTIGPSYI